MAPKLEVERLRSLAETGSAKDVENLLRAYGDSETTDYRYTCMDWISSGVNRSTREQSEKKTLITSFMAQTGVFADKQEVTTDAAAELRAEFSEAIAQATAPLTARIEELEKLLEGKPTRIKVAAQPTTSRPH